MKQRGPPLYAAVRPVAYRQQPHSATGSAPPLLQPLVDAGSVLGAGPCRPCRALPRHLGRRSRPYAAVLNACAQLRCRQGSPPACSKVLRKPHGRWRIPAPNCFGQEQMRYGSMLCHALLRRAQLTAARCPVMCDSCAHLRITQGVISRHEELHARAGLIRVTRATGAIVSSRSS